MARWDCQIQYDARQADKHLYRQRVPHSPSPSGSAAVPQLDSFFSLSLSCVVAYIRDSHSDLEKENKIVN